MPRLSIPLTTEQLTAIRHKALDAGLPMTEIVRRFLFAWLADEIDYEPQEQLTEYELYAIAELIYKYKHGSKWTSTLGKLGRMRKYTQTEEGQFVGSYLHRMEKIFDGKPVVVFEDDESIDEG